MEKSSKEIEKIRHSLSHLLAMAVLEKFPKAKLGIGPVIEDGFYYDFDLPKPISPEDLPELEKKIKELAKKGLKFKKEFISLAEAKKLFKGQAYKLDLVKELNKNKEKLSIYKTLDGDEIAFLDLCSGPHVSSTAEIPADALKLTKIAGAYWRGDEKNPMLTRIYGMAFGTKKELEEHLKMMEEAQKRDHRELGKKLEIFTIVDEVGAGLVLWLPKGTIIRQELEKWARETERAWGYQHVSTPHITKSKLYEISGHLPYYTDDLYAPFEIEGEKYYLKPMNCPHTHMIYKHRNRSYRELPLRLAEYGQVYRYERSGTLHGLMRVRGFCQNDAHIYVQPEEAVDEFVRVLKLHEYYYGVLGIKDWWVVLGVRDPKNLRAKYHGDDAMWKEAEKLSRQALEKAGVKYEIEEGGAAHYGPKADIYIKSVIGKAYAIGTDQLDLYMPGRFNLTYVDKDGSEKIPYVIHRAPLGSHERLIGFLLEHYAGAFPVWLAPVQAKILPVSAKFGDYAKKVFGKLKDADIRAEIDESNETLNKKIRNAQLEKIPYMLIVGEKEKNSGTVAERGRSGKDYGQIKIEDFILNIRKEIEEKTL